MLHLSDPGGSQEPDHESAPFTVLAVDDDAGIRELVRIGLTGAGYAVDLAGSADEARQALRRRDYGLVLSDHHMPGESGLDLLAHVMEHCPESVFILLTADAELAKRAIGQGATDFLPKPFKLDQLVRLIEQNRTRHHRDRSRTLQLTRDILAGTIRSLVSAVDAKDPHTASHSTRVTALAGALGAAVGLTPERLQILEFAALVHDVGKIAIPDEILRKPGPLTQDERTLVRQHPIRSQEILDQVPQLAEVGTIVRHHHERIDGCGYPDGLTGEQIPELSRIITVADAFEAMISDRAYRPALGPVRACEVVRAGLGTEWDSELGRVFLDQIAPAWLHGARSTAPPLAGGGS